MVANRTLAERLVILVERATTPIQTNALAAVAFAPWPLPASCTATHGLLRFHIQLALRLAHAVVQTDGQLASGASKAHITDALALHQRTVVQAVSRQGIYLVRDYRLCLRIL